MYNELSPLKKFAYPFWLVYGIIILYNVTQGDSLNDIILEIIVGIVTTFVTALILWYIAFNKLPNKIKTDISEQITNEIQSQDEGKIPSQHIKLERNLSNEHGNLSNEHGNLSNEHGNLSNENKQLLEYARIVHESNIRKEGIDLANGNVIRNLEEVIATIETKEDNLKKYQINHAQLKKELIELKEIKSSISEENTKLANQLKEVKEVNLEMLVKMENLELEIREKNIKLSSLQNDLELEKLKNQELALQNQNKMTYQDSVTYDEDFDMEM